MKTTLTRRQALAASLLLGTIAVTGCGAGTSNNPLYTIQAVVGLILTIKQLTRKSATLPGESPLDTLLPQARVALTAGGLPREVHITAEGVELHLSGGDKALKIGFPYAIAPIATTGNKALPGGTFTILAIDNAGKTVRFRIDNVQAQEGTSIVPITWEATAAF